MLAYYDTLDATAVEPSNVKANYRKCLAFKQMEEYIMALAQIQSAVKYVGDRAELQNLREEIVQVHLICILI
jgi:hypothetical protein